MSDALAGRGRFFLLVGEPGIGKTRLCDEITDAASSRGLAVLWGRAWEAGGAPAYWPWMDVLGGLARLVDAARLMDALGDGAPLVADLVPDIRAYLGAHLGHPRASGSNAPTSSGPGAGAASPAVSLPPDEARFRLCRAVVALVRRAAEPAGLVLIFDDLHSTDRSSLLLLYALARELRSLRVLVVATCRDVESRLDQDASELIAKLGREAMTLGLSRLDRDTAFDLIRSRVGALGPGLETRMFDRTQGNPLFLEEMLRLLEEEGEASIAANVVPAGVRDVIRQRVDRVKGEARELLDLAAVAGDEVSPPLLEAAARRAPAWIAAGIAEGLRAGVLTERAGRTRFSHALVREVLYRELGDDVRRALHAEVGAALEQRAREEGALPLILMELSHHAVEGPAGDLPRAVDFAIRAASRAMELTAPEEAVAVLGRVIAAVENAGNPPALRARVLLALGETRIRRGEVMAGKSLCCEVATLAASLGDPALLADAALAYGRVFNFAVVDPVLVQLLEDALEAQPPGDSATRARLLARLAGALQPSIVAAEPVRIAREAIATARRLGSRRALLETMHDGLSALMDVVDPRERRGLNLEVEALAVAENDRERLLRTHSRLALDHLALGELVEADARIDALEQLATEMRAAWILWRVPLLRAMRAVTHGRFAEAEALEEEARALARRVQDPQAERALTLHHEGLLRVAERHDEMRAWDLRGRQARATFHNGQTWQGLGSALIFTRLEDAEAARFHFDSLLPQLREPVDNLFAQSFIAEATAYVGSIELVEALYQRLAPAREQYVMLGMTQIQWEGPIARLLGLLSARLERWELSSAHFEDAIARLARLQARPHLGRTQYELARMLLRRGRTADAERARRCLESGRVIAAELGMSGLERLASARLAELAGSPEPAAPVTSAAPFGPVAPAAAPTRTGPVESSSDTRPEAAAAVAAGSAGGSRAALLAMVQEGEYFTVIARGTHAFRLKDSLGMQYLARLIAEPGREIHVLDLVSAGRTGAEEAPIDTGDAGPLLDDAARDTYRRRLEDLRDSLTEAEAFGDATRAASAREEIDFLGAELARAVGLGGRGRRVGSAAERARTAVQRRIKNAIDRIVEAAPELGPALGRAVRTGNFCVYRPEPGDLSQPT